MINKCQIIEAVPEWHRLNSPEHQFSEADQIELFNQILKWFVEQCINSPKWESHGDKYQKFVTFGLSQDQVKNVFKHFELYATHAGCNYVGYSGSMSSGNWLIGVGW